MSTKTIYQIIVNTSSIFFTLILRIMFLFPTGCLLHVKLLPSFFFGSSLIVAYHIHGRPIINWREGIFQTLKSTQVSSFLLTVYCWNSNCVILCEWLGNCYCHRMIAKDENRLISVHIINWKKSCFTPQTLTFDSQKSSNNNQYCCHGGGRFGSFCFGDATGIWCSPRWQMLALGPDGVATTRGGSNSQWLGRYGQ